MSNKIYTIDEIRKIISPIATRYGVERMFLFGSYARGEATTQSDLDFRLETQGDGSIVLLWQGTQGDGSIVLLWQM